MSDKEKEEWYKCQNCGAYGKYTLTVERHMEPIYDGPYYPPVAWDDQGSTVRAWCNVCKQDLEPSKKDMDQHFMFKKGIVWEK